MPGHKKMRSSDGLTGNDIVVGETDKREYRYKTLSNGIEAILVKIPDSQSSKAAVSVTVNAGSMHEPDAVGGLAHFVEHCIFLGNKKFPTRNSLDKLLAKHNGYSNAHTEMEFTAFYLEVNREGLSKAVDIFSSAFESPSFDTEMCCAELEAVDSEFHEIVSNDDCRVEQMIGCLSSLGHPYKKFCWGNRASLMKEGGDSLVASARTFFETHYQTNRMKVSIVSSYSFSKMETLLSEFERIPTRQSEVPIPVSALAGCPFPIPLQSLPVTLAIQPVTEMHQLVLLFQLPSILPHYRTKPVDYMAHLIGHESEGSLISVLRAANLAVDISAGVGSDGYSCNVGLALFEIKLNLTTHGVSQWSSIATDYVFPYIEKIRESGITESVYNEMKKVGAFQFNHTSEESTKEPIDTAEELAIQMLSHFEIDRKHLLVSDYLFEHFDPVLISEFLSCVTPERAITMIVSPAIGGWDLTDPIFNIKYRYMTPVDCTQTTISVGGFVIPPNPNPFVPEPGTATAVLATQTGDVFTEPTEVLTEGGVTMYLFDQIRTQASSKVDIRIRFNLCHDTVVDRTDVVTMFTKTHLWVAYLTDLLEPQLYNPKLVGYGVSIAAVPPGQGKPGVGIEVCVNGFHEKIVKVLSLITNELKLDGSAINVDANRLARVAEVLRRGFVNEEVHPITTQALNMRKVALAPSSFFRSGEKLAASTALDLTSAYGNAFVCESIDSIVVGSYTEGLVAEVKRLLCSYNTVAAAPVSSNGSGMTTIVTEEQLFTESAINPDEPTSCLIMYYQLASSFSVEVSAIADVISDVMSEAFFDSLRTEEQLGYSVQCGSRYTNGSIGIEFMIQSSCETPAAMVARIERFIVNFWKKEIAPMSQEEFADQISSLVEGLVETPNSLAREAKDIWNEVVESRLCWKFNQLIKAEIEAKYAVDKAVIKRLIDENLIGNAASRRIVVHVNGGRRKQE